jgi:hypothetical protein
MDTALAQKSYLQIILLVDDNRPHKLLYYDNGIAPHCAGGIPLVIFAPYNGPNLRTENSVTLYGQEN